ncbi:MAG: U6 snRNA-associated Sm-like protein LSm6 [Nitrososphaerales archaeon]|nr:U6 snRNA-associated Sm-like protein LSm6 [Nitrososphaerales archaeon]
MSNNFNSNSETKITKPLNKLQRSINKNVMVRLKNDVEYRGKMTNVDAYMNVILNDAEEFADGSLSANFGKVVIRGNNVLFINIRPDILM